METSASDRTIKRKTTIRVIRGGECGGITGQGGKCTNVRSRGSDVGVRNGSEEVNTMSSAEPPEMNSNARIMTGSGDKGQRAEEETKPWGGVAPGSNVSPSDKNLRSDDEVYPRNSSREEHTSTLPTVASRSSDVALKNQVSAAARTKDNVPNINERQNKSDKDAPTKTLSTNSLPAMIGGHRYEQYITDKRQTAPLSIEAVKVSVDARKRNGLAKSPANTDKTSGNLSPDAVVSKESKRSKKQKAHDTKNIIQAIFVRCLLSISSLLCVWRAADVMGDDKFWLLGLANVILGIETILIVKFRKGKETIWICPCFVIYLCATVPSIWILQLDKIKRYTEYSDNGNASLEALSTISGVTLPFSLEPDTWVSVLQQSLLFILVIGRMILPRGNLSREQLSQLLFVFIGAGSDVVEFFVVFDEPEFRSNSTLLYASLIVWSASLLQFSLVLTSVKNSKKTRLGQYMDAAERDHKSMFGIEILSLWVSIILMDGPYFCLRLYAMVKFRVLSYGIIFFACKNVLMLMLLFYRMSIICVKLNSREKRKKLRAWAELSKV